MWNVGGRQLSSRLMLGSAKYPSLEQLVQAIKNAETNVVTISLRRSRLKDQAESQFIQEIANTGIHFLPNTSGCFSMDEIITVAEMAREIFSTNWVKVEAIGDDYTLYPDPMILVPVTAELIKRDFIVFPYTSPDLVICQKLVDVGAQILMPLAAPIGTGLGPIYQYDLERLRDRFTEQTLIVDAGIGRPSHAAQVMEMGFDGVLLNTAVAEARDPVVMAGAFAGAIRAGYDAYRAGMIEPHSQARASSPMIDRPFWHQTENIENIEN